MPASILWYDLETFGRDPAHDRIAQCAMLRTDENLVQMEEPMVLYCKPPLDYLPDPEACFVHGLSPVRIAETGRTEYECARVILQQMSQPATTVAGYNSIQFDDEFIRYLLYRNLFEPYRREWEHDNARWDVLNLMRAVHDLKGDGLVWPVREDGMISYRLEDLARENGIVEQAHDALGDVRAMVELVRRIRERHPKLYAWYYRFRRRSELQELVNLPDRSGMLLHTAPYAGEGIWNTTIIAPLGMVDGSRHDLAVFDLRHDPSGLVDLSEDELVEALEEAERSGSIPVYSIRLNRCPYLAPPSVLEEDRARIMGIDPKLCKARLRLLDESKKLRERLVRAHVRRQERYLLQEDDGTGFAADATDPEYALYEGFFSNEARAGLGRLHSMLEREGPEAAKRWFVAELAAYRQWQTSDTPSTLHPFSDRRLPPLIGRFLARNFPETLTASEKARWLEYCRARLQLPPRAKATQLADYDRLEEKYRGLAPDDTRRIILGELLAWKRRVTAALEPA
ncbi:MAG: exodeoxyribonuclease I [Spirochaetales bacterium]|nr:exodeoxyribonuclease I [Spirochaetales bacterium]